MTLFAALIPVSWQSPSSFKDQVATVLAPHKEQYWDFYDGGGYRMGTWCEHNGHHHQCGAYRLSDPGLSHDLLRIEDYLRGRGAWDAHVLATPEAWNARIWPVWWGDEPPGGGALTRPLWESRTADILSRMSEGISLVLVGLHV